MFCPVQINDLTWTAHQLCQAWANPTDLLTSWVVLATLAAVLWTGLVNVLASLSRPSN